MNYTEKLEEKYPLHIIQNVRQRFGLEKNDTSTDEEILKMTSKDVFKEVVAWNGLLGGYDTTIKEWIKSIYGIDIDDFQK
jgi:hypothetical protein